MKTGGVKILVEDVLTAMPKPYSEHVIDEVFAAIEQSPRWRRETIPCATFWEET